MIDIHDYLNKKNSTRDLLDEEFEILIPELAEQLCYVTIENEYTNRQLIDDWTKLKSWSGESNYINSTSRIGMKLCEHFFPNFYEITNNKGNSVKSLWNKDNIIKILRWNRKSHSTPYLSELKRGIYFCCGMTKNTMYRPQMAKLICDYYKPKVVLDPCAGWGGRMLGVVASGANYIAFEPNTKTYNNLQRLIDFLGIKDKVTIICDDAMNMDNYDISNVDLIITSPPYFDLEVYTNEATQSITKHTNYKDWSEYFLLGIIEKCNSKLNIDGVSCWNVGKVGKNDMNDDVLKYQTQLQFNKINTFSVVSSKRQANQTNEIKKSSDITVVYKNQGI